MGFLESVIRSEMKRRVDQILKASDIWGLRAKELTTALNNLTEAIEKGKIDTKLLKPIIQGTSKLSKSTGKLGLTLKKYSATLTKINEQIEKE